MQCFPMPYPPHYQGESSRVPVHDRLGPHQSGPVQQAAPVRPVTSDRSDRSHQRPGQVPAPRFEYRIKEKKEEQKLVADPEKPKTDVVQISEVKVPIKDTGKKPMNIEKSVEVPSQNRLWPMIMSPVAARVQRTSTISLGGAGKREDEG